MNADDFPAPRAGFVITHVVVVADPDRSREFYRSLLGGQVPLERDPVITKVGNTWLTLATGGGPTDDKPGVSLSTPRDPGHASGFLNVRVAGWECPLRPAPLAGSRLTGHWLGQDVDSDEAGGIGGFFAASAVSAR
jgi:hypothetical protein